MKYEDLGSFTEGGLKLHKEERVEERRDGEGKGTENAHTHTHTHTHTNTPHRKHEGLLLD